MDVSTASHDTNRPGRSSKSHPALTPASRPVEQNPGAHNIDREIING